jgi:hypothetical protein
LVMDEKIKNVNSNFEELFLHLFDAHMKAIDCKVLANIMGIQN